ncbi:hypothetical protein [Streptomyces sp. NPDC056160]|uniref:hypothetical protein n=1 Tax=Streptomyces sp. NPDC056160 TaxID=3345731 RepID=UPI0035DBC723
MADAAVATGDEDRAVHPVLLLHFDDLHFDDLYFYDLYFYDFCNIRDCYVFCRSETRAVAPHDGGTAAR